MGRVRTHLRLANVARPDLDEIDARALVDTGALHLCIPRHVALQLGLSASSQREVRLADGTPQMVDYVGPIRVSLLGRESFTGALVLGDEVRLGVLPMEDMGLPADLSTAK